MRVLIPFTVFNPEVAEGLPPWAEWADVSGDPHAYWRVIAEHWVPDGDLIILEHDVVTAGTDVFAQFEACPEPWCTFNYANMCTCGLAACREGWADMLGCTRFRKELIAATPDALTSIPVERRDWHFLCNELAGDKIRGTPCPLRPGSVRHAGFTHHWHVPDVPHHPWGIRENMMRLGLDPGDTPA